MISGRPDHTHMKETNQISVFVYVTPRANFISQLFLEIIADLLL